MPEKKVSCSHQVKPAPTVQHSSDTPEFLHGRPAMSDYESFWVLLIDFNQLIYSFTCPGFSQLICRFWKRSP